MDSTGSTKQLIKHEMAKVIDGLLGHELQA